MTAQDYFERGNGIIQDSLHKEHEAQLLAENEPDVCDEDLPDLTPDELEAGHGALDANIGASGAILRFRRVITMSHVLKMMVRMKKAWIRIGEISEAELL